MPALSATDQRWEVMQPIVREWLNKARAIVRDKKWTKFQTVAKQCRDFYAGSVGFMWEGQYREKYLGGFDSPFRITLNKSFEYVAVFGPRMYFNNPKRDVRPRRDFELNPEWLMQGQQGMQDQIFLQYAMQLEQQRKTRHDIQAALMRQYLNFTPDESPRGGLRANSMKAITDALITGRGILWPETYRVPGTRKQSTGLFHDDQENLLIDPDATSLGDAHYIMKKEQRPYWEFEREFGLPRNSLQRYASRESTTRSSVRQASGRTRHSTEDGKSNDLMTVYKIWSKMGIGGRFTGMFQNKLSDAFDEVLGDYVYLALSEDVPWPLNAPRSVLESQDDNLLRERLAWPAEFWRDNGKWPFVEVSFYADTKSPYPVAPMAAGLGELMFMNVFISMLAHKTAATSRTLIAVAKSAAADLKQHLESSKIFDVLEIGEFSTRIDELVKTIEFNSVNSDAWRILDLIAQSFERATGLNEILLASSPSTQSRSATESKQRQTNASIRPEYMARQVFNAMQEAADMEKTLAMLSVRPEDVADIVGAPGALLWGKHISTIPPDRVFREVRMTVVPEDMKLPNKEKDREALASVLPTVFPEWSKYAEVTGDTGPINALVEKILKAAELDQDIENIKLGPLRPEPDPAQQQAQQEAAQLEMAKLQADVQKQQLAAQKSQVDLAKAQMDLAKAQMDAQGKQSDVAANIAKNRSEMALRQQEFGIKQGEQALKAEELAQKGQMGGVELAQAGVDLERSEVELQQSQVDVAAAIQEAAMARQKHEQDMELAARQQALAERTARSQGNGND